MVPSYSQEGSTTPPATPPSECTETLDLHFRPCQFIAPPPPDNPPPLDSFTPVEEDAVFVYGSGSEMKVAESSTQVHVTLRDSLSSGKHGDYHLIDSLLSESMV